MHKKTNRISRRDYLKMSLMATGALAMGGFNIACNPLRKQKLNIALIGGGGIAKTAFADCKNENVVAIADVDDITGGIGFEAFPNAKRYRDWRRMLDAHYKELDLVIVSTPDHTHFAATYAAMERGIAVHTQKPLTHNIWQARTLREAAHKFNVQTVMGNQGHNFEGMRLIKDWYDAGLVGEVLEVHAWTNRTTENNANARLEFPAQPIPETLDWNLWQGPAKERAYNKTFCPQGWRWHWDYGSGGLGDIGCHTLDIPVYVMGLGYPSAVYMDNSLDFRQEFDNKIPNVEGATYVYEFPASGNRSAVKVYWYEGGRMPKFPKEVYAEIPEMKKAIATGGCMMIGDKNTVLSPSMRPVKPKLIYNWQEIEQTPVEKTTPRPVGNPVKEIIAAVKGDIDKCGSNFDYAVPLTEIVLLGTIAIRSNKKVIYNPESMTFSDSSLNCYIKEPVRKGWEYGEGLI
ncbi:Gfo/Idh/MocA family oxidoreductase [uncultured Draconibacterium sp.]|uniref:Gfo/Idh/MocA family protein n=1 Tax=uncultured Draconibacterium sp. TaxID=1573823 RepID=UPI0029C6ADEC|nr:Gfo/Idh/MocA family oxidoreductase [uncultured Draconibacterium sp.]